MTLNQLRAFVEAALHGSFTAAAAVLEISQASVSELIRRLEDEHELTLFVRGRPRLVLTAAGQQLLPYAEKAVAAAEDARRALRSAQSLSGGVVTFGVVRGTGDHLLAGLVRRFTALHPAVRARIVGLHSADVAAAVAHGRLEAGVVSLPVEPAGLLVTPWARDEILYVTGRAARMSGPVSIDRMAQARLVLYNADAGSQDPTRRQLVERARVAGVGLDPWIEVEHVDTALEIAAHGAVDTIASSSFLAGHPSDARLHTAPLDPPLFDTIALIRRDSAQLTPVTREIARLAHAILREDRTLSAVG